ncbi:MAG: TIR domain-containing protein [Nitrosopumilus sp.]|nr:TIR domain-containing protein [Nitrosopumilus sp.]
MGSARAGIKPRAFISYSNEKKDLAAGVRRHMEEAGIDAFLSDRDIRSGTKWEDKIISEIGLCKYFIVVLTEDYHRRDYTDQEFGIAIGCKRNIHILGMGGRPYGFMKSIQVADAAKYGAQGFFECIYEVIEEISNGNTDMVLEYLVNVLTKSENVEMTAFYAGKIKDQNLDKGQLDRIAAAYIDNCHIHCAESSGIIENIICRSMDRISRKYVEKLSKPFICADPVINDHMVEIKCDGTGMMPEGDSESETAGEHTMPGMDTVSWAWSRGMVIFGSDPSVWRQDEHHSTIKRDEYGQKSKHGWIIDHIIPTSEGGTDDIGNIKPVHWKNVDH